MTSLPAHEFVWDYPRPPGIERSGTRTFCEWKGQARYWRLRTETGPGTRGW
jgi:hypothetical protein